MDTDVKKLKKLVKFMQDQGVLVVKLPDLELQLSPSALFKSAEAAKKAPAAPEDESVRPLTDEEILMWSSAGIPEETADGLSN